MKRFRFNLQAVHTLRQRLEQVALEAYSQTLARRQAARAVLGKVERDLGISWDILRELRAAGGSAERLRRATDFCQFLDEQRQLAATAVQTAQQAVDAAWKKLVVARQRREAVEKYRQRQWAAHRAAAQREDQKLLDEVAQRRAASGVSAWGLGPVLQEV